jgi:hypothetical protein
MKFRDIIPIIIITVIAFAILLYTTKSSEGFKVDISDYVAQLAERNIVMSRNASFNTATAASTQTGGEVLSTQAPAAAATEENVLLTQEALDALTQEALDALTADLSEYDPAIYKDSSWELICKKLGMKNESGVLFTEDECLNQLGGDSWQSYSNYVQLPPLYNRVSIELGFCGRDGISLSDRCTLPYY